jgi:outer membrane protein OmpA-like peptidoglycan-associated protein
MRAAILLTPFMPWLMLLASCTSPPKPPTVDESLRRPVNTALAVEVQGCKNELQNTRLIASEASRAADASSMTLASLAARQEALAATLAQVDRRGLANLVFTIEFAFGATRVDIPAPTVKMLADEARESPLIVLRGRTDGIGDSPGESRIARDRAASVRELLVAAGVDPSHIRATYQPIGDHVADNGTPTGRALNRRVEIEIYRALPVVSTLRQPAG